MSNVIRDIEKANQRQLESVKKRQERELRALEGAHDALKADMKQSQQRDLVDVRSDHHQQIDDATLRKERVLADLRSQLQEANKMSEKELKNIKTHAANEKQDLAQRSSLDRERMIAENELYIEDLNDRFNRQVQKVNHDGQNRVNQATTAMQEQFLTTEKFQQDKLSRQSEEFTTRFKQDGRKYQDLKDQQDSTFKRDRLSTNARQQHELQKMTDTHAHHVEQRGETFRKGLKDQDLFFEKKYEGQLKVHNDQFKKLEEKNKKVVEDLKASLTKELSFRAERNDDPFYNFEALKPNLRKFEDRIEITVSVPDHAKQDMQLTINGKEAILSFNRRYSDAAKAPEGTINRINKIESFTTRLQTGVFLDPKSVKSSYANGELTYVVKRS